MEKAELTQESPLQLLEKKGCIHDGDLWIAGCRAYKLTDVENKIVSYRYDNKADVFRYAGMLSLHALYVQLEYGIEL